MVCLQKHTGLVFSSWGPVAMHGGGVFPAVDPDESSVRGRVQGGIDGKRRATGNGWNASRTKSRRKSRRKRGGGQEEEQKKEQDEKQEQKQEEEQDEEQEEEQQEEQEEEQEEKQGGRAGGFREQHHPRHAFPRPSCLK